MKRSLCCLLIPVLVLACVSAMAEGPWNGLLAEASVYCGGDSAALHNAGLAADSIYDTTLASGDTFSFRSVVGPLEAGCGYVEAADGTGAIVTGGGAGRVASAVWLAVQSLPDVSVVEKSTYGGEYSLGYVASSSDAVDVDSGSGADFAFRYTGDGCITVYTWIEGDWIRCEIVRNA